MKIEQDTCFLCGSDKAMPPISIALSMSGDDYSFCRKCLKSMTADKFWSRFIKSHGYVYPPKRINESENA